MSINKYKIILLICITKFLIFTFFGISFFISNLTFKLEFNLLITFLNLVLVYIILWFILYGVALKYENKNQQFPKWLKIISGCLFMTYIIFSGKEKQQRKKQVIFGTIFNQFWLTLFFSLLLVVIYLMPLQEKSVPFYSFIVCLTLIWLINLIRTGFFIFLYFYSHSGNRFLKIVSLILIYPTIYHKVICLNTDQEYPILKFNKIKWEYKKQSDLYMYYRKRRNWLIFLILVFIYISIFALGSAITMNQLKYNILFSVLSFCSLFGMSYLFLWFVCHKVAIKYEIKNQKIPNWLRVITKTLCMNYLNKYQFLQQQIKI